MVFLIADVNHIKFNKKNKERNKKNMRAKEKPNATQKEIAQHIGKSERTVKSMTVNLSERGIIERKNGRRNGFWEIKK